MFSHGSRVIQLSACLPGSVAVNISSMKPFSRLLPVFLLWCALASLHSIPAAEKPSVHVILWFDTEDYLLPADDDATKRLAEMLTGRGIRATFKRSEERRVGKEGRSRWSPYH